MNIKTKFFIFIPLAGYLFFSCQETNKEKENTSNPENKIVQVMDSSKLTDTVKLGLVYKRLAGKYFGILPCADCSGIETTITIKENGTYIFDRTYLVNNQKGNNTVSEGHLEVSGDEKLIILPELVAPNKYLIGEANLTQLDMDGKIIVGELAKNYILHKQ